MYLNKSLEKQIVRQSYMFNTRTFRYIKRLEIGIKILKVPHFTNQKFEIVKKVIYTAVEKKCVD